MRRLIPALAFLAAVVALALPSSARADDWTITSFDVEYEIDELGFVQVTEDIRLDFGFLQKHGIFRDM
ncbi:MAG: hypothetical protein WEE64_07550, partial [Dehalococcoidia bacterium]